MKHTCVSCWTTVSKTEATVSMVVMTCIFSTDSSEDASYIVTRALNSKLHFQSSKQGFGTLCAGSLRVNFNKNVDIGYLPRAITSAISGSWVSEYVLNQSECCNSMLRTIWNMQNRADVASSSNICRNQGGDLQQIYTQLRWQPR